LTIFLLHLEFDVDIVQLTDVLERIGATENDCVAFRVHWPSGEFWDGYLGGTKDEIQAALAALKADRRRNMH
jgi:hypothetical protein